LPPTVTFCRSVDAQTPMVEFFAFRSAIGICRAIAWTP
jgi:hypothetical protein